MVQFEEKCLVLVDQAMYEGACMLYFIIRIFIILLFINSALCRLEIATLDQGICLCCFLLCLNNSE